MYPYKKVSHLAEAPEALLEASKMKDLVFPLLRTFRCKVGVQKEVLENNVAARVYMSGNAIRLYLYQEDCPLAFGFLDYGTPMQRSNTEMFYIASPNIVNGRYAWHSSQHYYAMAKDADKMLKKAQRYFRLLKPENIADFFWRDKAMSNFHHEKYERQTDVRNARDRISKQDEVVEEIEHLYRSGHVFLSPKLSENIAALVKLTDELALPENQRNGRVVYVYLRKDGMLDAVEFDGDTYNTLSTPTIPTELPDEVVRRVTALTMCKDGQHVKGVGTRIADNCFYVYA
jgi:hypothetical protein